MRLCAGCRRGCWGTSYREAETYAAAGCPSLDICGVAAGTLDVFYECGLGQWDIAAAAAIAEAAGAKILLLNSRVLPNPFVVVANGKLMPAMVALLAETGVVETSQ